ncbi:hypothetical protein HELRODRAFT_175808 [Helobdella robusta]|uniref:Uncharacterized protein n=1 Tax=Helobdella robusta TaxID=6412 RepID=T1F9P4_HELRO|nr:hypothetical protein HELRODRAFT_175808 [Helobdella robusta]ESO00391.1 hypothetical protein HELRODRAFT_175808 [Helobdella robusta]
MGDNLLKKVKSKRKNEISDENVDSVVISSPNKKDVCGESNSDGGSDVESQQTIKKNKENRSTKNNSKCDEKSKQLKYYEKIARHCRLLPVGARYKATFEFCSNEKDKIEKIKTILKNAGMTGRISMEEAEKLKLRQEAAELNTDNIISLSGNLSF